MAKDLSRIPLNILRLVEPLFAEDESYITSFRESFNWDLVTTWLLLTSERIIVVGYYVIGETVNDYELSGMSVKYVQDNIGPYDLIQFELRGNPILETSVLRNRREEAKAFIHLINDAISFKQNPKKEPFVKPPCLEKLDTYRIIGAFSEEEYLKEKLKNKKCK